MHVFELNIKNITCAIERDPRNPGDETYEAHIFFFILVVSSCVPLGLIFWYGRGSSTKACNPTDGD
jgi:hypothetical protein